MGPDNNSSNIYFLRQFKSAKYGLTNQIQKGQLDELSNYVTGKGEVALGNSVTKLQDKTEKEGLGRFLYETLGLDVTTAQSSSQLAAVFVEAGIWTWNGKQRGMMFKAYGVHWEETLRTYYKRQLNGIEG